MPGVSARRSLKGRALVEGQQRRAAELEADVGIAEYASPGVSGIGGVLKRLPTDFRVNELDVNGGEVTLDTALPQHASSGADGDGEEEEEE